MYKRQDEYIASEKEDLESYKADLEEALEELKDMREGAQCRRCERSTIGMRNRSIITLMLCLLTEIIIRLLQGTYASPMNQPSNSVHKSAMDELFDRIIAYIDENIYLPLTIPEICEHFSLSRTALQLMFKNSIDQSPKKYINDKKLERSCQMLLENRYTISEISLRLGYTSIHYFSKSFNMKYHMSPSEFVKQNLQNKK